MADEAGRSCQESDEQLTVSLLLVEFLVALQRLILAFGKIYVSQNRCLQWVLEEKRSHTVQWNTAQKDED